MDHCKIIDVKTSHEECIKEILSDFSNFIAYRTPSIKRYEISLKTESNIIVLKGYKDINCYLLFTLVLGDNKVKVLNKQYEGFKDIKINFAKTSRVLILECDFKSSVYDANDLSFSII